MIVEVSAELLLALLRPGKEIHVRIEDGVSTDYHVAGVGLNERGNIALAIQHINDEEINPAPYAVTVTSLDCTPALTDMRRQRDDAVELLGLAYAALSDSETRVARGFAREKIRGFVRTVSREGAEE